MTRRLLLVAVACSLVLSGCVGGLNPSGGDSGPDATTQSTVGTTAETTAASTTTELATETAATTTSSAPRHRVYDTREALAANASFSVPSPNVSEPFAFDGGVEMELAGGRFVAMAYHDVENGSLENVLSIRKAENASSYDLTVGNATTVGDREARYVESGDGGKLLWECDGYFYRVSVQQFTDAFGEAQLRAVAESVGCE